METVFELSNPQTADSMYIYSINYYFKHRLGKFAIGEFPAASVGGRRLLQEEIQEKRHFLTVSRDFSDAYKKKQLCQYFNILNVQWPNNFVLLNYLLKQHIKNN